MDSKLTTNEGSEGNEEHVNMENGVKGIFVIQWLNCIIHLCGKHNLYEVNLIFS